MLTRLLERPGWLLGVAATLLAAPFVVPWWERDFYFDSAVFGGLAQSLLAGEGYRFQDLPHGKYPPGFPGLLALVQWLGLGVRGVHLVVAAGAVGSVVLTFRLLRHRHGRWFAFGAAGLTLVNHDFLGHQAHVLSDLPYLALSLGAILSAERMRDDASWRRTLLTAALCVAAASVRSIGVVLAPAILLGLLARRRGPGEAATDRALALRAGVVAAVTLAAVGSWLAYGEHVTRETRVNLLETVPYHQELVRKDAVDESRGTLEA
ncbi:MAG: ArnT family glycosyltransferase, partial [Myxococcota bacterium]